MKKPLNEQFRRMQKLAGIITENTTMNEGGDSTKISLTPEVKTFIDKAIQSSISRGDMEKLQKAGYWEGDFPDYILDEFGDDFPEAYSLSKEVEDYIQDAVYVTENTTTMNEEDDMDDEGFDITADFKASPEHHSYKDILNIIDSWGDKDALNDFKSTFSEGKEISKKDYANFCYKYIDDMAETVYYKANWISLTDPSIFDKI